MNNFIKKFLLPVIMSILGIGACLYRLFKMESALPDYLIMAIYFILIWMIHIIKILKVSKPLECIYYLFIFISMLIGSILKLYDLISWWDILAHTTWGYVACLFGIFILCKLRSEKQNIYMIIFFCFITSMATASLWEMFEFTCDRLFATNVQHWEDTGVFDTMYDIICNFFGAFLFVVHYIIDYAYMKNKFFNSIFKDLIHTPKIDRDKANTINDLYK